MGGEILDPDSRKDEKSGVVDQPGAVELLLLGRPSHPAVPDLDLGGRSEKGEGGHRLLSDPGDVFDPAAGKVLVAQGVVIPDQGVPEILLPGSGIHRHDGDLPQVLEGSQNHLAFTDNLLCRFQPSPPVDGEWESTGEAYRKNRELSSPFYTA